MSDDVATATPDPPRITFQRFNPIRARRKAPAAEFEISDGDGTCLLWMTKRDIERNIIEFPEPMNQAELRKGLEAYR